MNPPKPRSLLVPGLVLTALAVMTFVVSFGAFLAGRYEVTRFTSPGGGFTAVVTSRRFESFVVRAPGSGSDKPGALEIIRADGRSCGRSALPMVSLAGDLRWELELKPRSATVIGTATWNLDDCSVTEW